jgi:hypothetical protein
MTEHTFHTFQCLNTPLIIAHRSARTLEALPFKFFSEWQSSMILALPTLVFVVMYTPRWYWFPGAYYDLVLDVI